ncbi:hypothetical protein F4553_004567 [Allocatelliglobosispora scoriae]|uniref:DUF559 domain-containing protein n=1 Tax=Allocatelliglobosispora scoriae TaxID=643052 RepID=A0A841BUR1_9ACTN|nr:hypothetical protein [Allocatelliglobosispora scoriae]MBB5871188.1 hypothetical protein [Allocatelliglobosispora scoriae]
MPRQASRPDLSGLTELQYGLVRRDQVVGSMLTDAALRWKLEKGHWQAVLPSVYATHNGRLTPEERAFAGLLYAGEDSQLTGPVALHLHGFRSVPAHEHVHVLIPDHRRVASARFAVVSRTGRLCAHAVTIGRMAVAGAARAVADTARLGIGLREARALVAEAVQTGLAGVDAIATELREGPRRGSLRLRQALDEISAGVRSAPEAELRELCSRSSVLPPIAWHPRLIGPHGDRLPTPTAWIGDVAIALQIESPEDWHMHLQQRQAFADLGAQTLRFAPDQISGDPAAVRSTIEHAYLDRARRGVPQLIQPA